MAHGDSLSQPERCPHTEFLDAEMRVSGTACVLSVPTEDFHSLGNSVQERFGSTTPEVG